VAGVEPALPIFGEPIFGQYHHHAQIPPVTTTGFVQLIPQGSQGVGLLLGWY
tara:strand:- start:3470 stop:3625 length:156 start_codon:yes stop_codon:yes gene_type:complete